MVEISTDSRNRTGPRQLAGSRASTARSTAPRSRHQGRLQLLEPPGVGEVPGADHADALAPPDQGQMLQVAVPATGSRVLRVDVEVGVERRHGPNLSPAADGHPRPAAVGASTLST